ncbi:pks3, partial [Symbiodinium sp. KB8]
TDLTGPDRLDYQHVTFTWVEGWQLYSHEVTYYLINDCLLLGHVLAFTATYYFHYEIMGWRRLTVLDFVSLFLIVGISADDILLLFNTSFYSNCFSIVSVVRAFGFFMG